VAGDHDGEGAVKRVLLVAAGWLAGLCLVALLFVAAAVHLMRPAAGEWSHPVRIGPWHTRLSVPAMLRVATHPAVMRLIEGRSMHGSFGTVQFHAAAQPDTWQAVCAPCRVRLNELGDDEIEFARIAATWQRPSQNDWRGEFALGQGAEAVRGRWTAHLTAQGIEFQFKLADTPLADAFRLFADALPEVHLIRIDGQLRLEASLRLPQRELTIRPEITGFVVDGLGTEALLHATPSCDIAAHGFGTWLPRAVVAAEDQRFYEHSGYDLRELGAAWSLNQRQGGAARGGSTLSQQVAKLLYAGDGRNHVRKLRELLYAVELDRTLGKARVLNLYLAIVPWGEGRCGAHAAARHYLRRPVEMLTPVEAAWLASLLHNPDREWTRFSRTGQVNVSRVAWVIDHLRPMSTAKREAAMEALPGWSPRPDSPG
jgi:hypothetical protein